MSWLNNYLKEKTKEERREIRVRLPRITFSRRGYSSWNMWDFTCWVGFTILMLCGVALIAFLVAFWGHSLYKNATKAPEPHQEKSAKQLFVENCEGTGYHAVPNVGSNDPEDWKCEAVR